MSDIFISYKREEQPVARKLADALQKKGWSVWWDPKLRAGEHFDDAIEKALSDAKCVIVMWSKRSVKSRYVKDEATYALKHSKLVPIAIEEVDLSFRFEGIQTMRLINWDGSDSFPEFQKLVTDIAVVLGEPPIEVEEHKHKEQQAKRKPKTKRKLRKTQLIGRYFKCMDLQTWEDSMLDIHVFFSYSHKDEEYRDELASHLKLFERKGEIKSWHDRSITPGSKWKDEIDERIYKADIILALVSSDFLASDYCYEIELKTALDQHNRRRSVLIPIIVRSVSWSASPLGELQALPTGAKPVTMWDDRDAAWTNVTDGILKSIKTIRDQKEKFLERIPSSLREFARDCACMITNDDSAVNRRIEHLACEHPKIHDAIKDYRKIIEDYIDKLIQWIEEAYDAAYSDDSLRKSSMSMRFVELCESHFKCVIKELGVYERFQQVNNERDRRDALAQVNNERDRLGQDHLEPSLFGFAKKSHKELMAEMEESQKMYLDAQNVKLIVLSKILRRNSKTPEQTL